MVSTLKDFQSMEEARQLVSLTSGCMSDAGLTCDLHGSPLGCYCLESVWSKPKDVRQVWICLNQPEAYGWGPWVPSLSQVAVLSPQFVPHLD